MIARIVWLSRLQKMTEYVYNSQEFTQSERKILCGMSKDCKNSVVAKYILEIWKSFKGKTFKLLKLFRGKNV